MYNWLEYSKNYEKTSGSLFNYYRDELNSSFEVGADNNISYSIKNSESFDYKTSITGELIGASREKDAKIAVPLKYLGNFWRNLDMPLINSEVSLILSWSLDCVLTSKAKRDALDLQKTPQTVEINNPTDATLNITNCKLYVPVVTLSAKEDNKLLEQLKSVFKRTIKWNKYVSHISNQTKNNNLNYLIDPTFDKVNRLFVLSFPNEIDRTSFSDYYTPTIEIKDYNVIIDGKSFFEMLVKNKVETYEKIIEMSKNSNYTMGNLLDYEYFKEHYKLIAIDLSKQAELENNDLKQQINLMLQCSLLSRKKKKLQ